VPHRIVRIWRAFEESTNSATGFGGDYSAAPGNSPTRIFPQEPRKNSQHALASIAMLPDCNIVLEASNVHRIETSMGVTMQTLSRRYVTAVEDLSVLILSEFEEQPGLRLTCAQIRRLWNLTEWNCRDVMEYLVSSGLLRLTADDQYCLPRYAE
jgi:hypothetical protein